MFTIKIADLKIAIDNKFDYVNSYCSDYIIDSKDFDFSVSVSDDEISKERLYADESISDAILENVCIYRKIADKLPKFNAFVIHCAAIEYLNQAFCFAAKSGTGKTTHINLWHEVFGDKVGIINGDKPVFRFINNAIMVYGTPWSGKERYNKNTSSPLKSICFLNQSKENSITKISTQDALNKILKQIYIPSDSSGIEKTIELIDIMLRNSSVWMLNCNISKEAVMLAYEAMNK